MPVVTALVVSIKKQKTHTVAKDVVGLLVGEVVSTKIITINPSYTSPGGGCIFLCQPFFFSYTCTKIFNFVAHHHFCSSCFLR